MNLKPTGPNLVTIECWAESKELVPVYAHAAEDAGCDLRANISEPVTVPPGEIVWIPTGFHLALPEGICALQCSRSGLACHHGLILVDQPGVIDPGYRGEVMCPMLNVSHEPYTLYPLERLCQLVILPFITAIWSVVGSLDELPPSSRGAGGYGSTGCM